jgi:hypothetical protein
MLIKFNFFLLLWGTSCCVILSHFLNKPAITTENSYYLILVFHNSAPTGQLQVEPVFCLHIELYFKTSFHSEETLLFMLVPYSDDFL